MINPDVVVEPVRGYSPEVAAWTGHLMPQLDPNFPDSPLPAYRLQRTAVSPHHELFVARYTGELTDEQRTYVRNTEAQAGPVSERGVIVGTGSMSEVWGAGFGERGQLEDFVTDDMFRRLGVGTALWEAFNDWCAGKGMDEFYLQTETFRPEAIEFYERMGGVLLPESVTFKVKAE